MIEPKNLTIGDKTYILSKFPAVAGREIVASYPLSGLPKLGDYKTNEAVMLKLMAFVGVQIPNMPQPLMLTNQDLINNHVPNWEVLAKIEIAMMEYNCSFFQNGGVSTFLDAINQKLPQWISKMLTALSGQLSQTEKPASTN